LEYLPPNPWGQLQDEGAQHVKTKGKKERRGKGYLLVELPGAGVTFRDIVPVRRHIDLEPISGAGLNAKELDAKIAEQVAKAKLDDQIVRLLVWDVDRAVARDLDHAAIRGYKARALNFQLDLRRPQAQRNITSVGPGTKRQTLGETVRDFLGRRPLDAELNRETFVTLGATPRPARVVPREAAPAAARQLPPARRYRDRVRGRHHRHHRAQRLGQDVVARGHRVGDLRQSGGTGRQGLDP
jgi:hypothetical protein